MALQFDDILLSIKSDAKGTLGTITKLTNALSGLQQTLDPNSLNASANALRSINSSVKGLSEKHVRRYERLANAIKAIGKSNLKRIGTPNQPKEPEYVPPARPANPTTDNRNLLQRLGDEFNTARNILKLDTKQVGDGLKEAFGEAAEFAGILGSKLSPVATVLGVIAGKVASLVKKGFQKLVDKVNSFRKGLERIGRIASLMMLRKAINAVVKGLQEGSQNLFMWDRYEGLGRVADKANEAKVALTAMKNATAVVIAPFIEPLVGVLQRVANWAIIAANAVARLFALLMGRSAYIAVKMPTGMADAFESAGGSAKKATEEFKRQLLAFDEINNLTPDTDDGGGGGGGGGLAQGMESMFETVETGFSHLADLFKSGQYDKFGQELGNMVNGWVDKIDANAIGQKIGGVIRDAFSIAYNFLTTVDFNNIGTKIGNFLTGIIQPLDGETIGRTLFRGISSGVDMLIGFIGGTDWSTVGTKFGEAVLGWLNAGIEWFDTNWDSALEDITKALGDFIEAVPWGEIGKKALELFVKAIEASLELAGGAYNVLADIFWGDFNNERGQRGHMTEDLFTHDKKVKRTLTLASKLGKDIGTYIAKGEESTYTPASEKIVGKTRRQWHDFSKVTGNTIETEIGGGFRRTSTEIGKLGTPIKTNISDPLAIASDRARTASTNIGGVEGAVRRASASNNLNTNVVTPLTNTNKQASGSSNNVSKLRNELGKITAVPKGITDLNGKLSDAKTNASQLNTYLNTLNNKTVNTTINHRETRTIAENVSRNITENITQVWGTRNKMGYSMYASGGYPTTGQMFIAREAGPELVGTIGGQTAVVNNQDIVSAVSTGVANAVASVMGSGQNVTVVLEGDAKGLFKAVQKEARGFSAQTGKMAFA